MGVLDSLLGQPQQRNDYQGFVSRYEQGHPAEGYDDREVSNRYQEVAPRLSPEEYQLSAQEAFSRMSPRERMQFGQMLQQGQQAAGATPNDRNGDGVDDRYQDPAYLAQVTGRMRQQNPGFLGQMLGSGQSGSVMSNPLAKAAMAGIAAMAVRRMFSGGSGGVSPGQQRTPGTLV